MSSFKNKIKHFVSPVMERDPGSLGVLPLTGQLISPQVMDKCSRSLEGITFNI
jgi:hypothetical protein